MAVKCDRCGQTVQASDRQCWHCGQTLQPTAPAGNHSADREINEADGDNLSISLSAVAFYGGMTAVCLLLLILLLQFFDRQPLYFVDRSVPRPRGWTVVTNQDQTFTFNLPPEWSWAEAAGAEERALSLTDPARLSSAQAALRPLAADNQPVFVATADTENAPFFFLIPLPDLSPSIGEIKTQLDDFPEARNVQSGLNNLGYNQLTFITSVPMAGETWSCRVKVLQQPGYLLTLCLPPGDFVEFNDDINAIVGSFQPLSP